MSSNAFFEDQHSSHPLLFHSYTLLTERAIEVQTPKIQRDVYLDNQTFPHSNRAAKMCRKKKKQPILLLSKPNHIILTLRWNFRF